MSDKTMMIDTDAIVSAGQAPQPVLSPRVRRDSDR
jgi:hypothetical protein